MLRISLIIYLLGSFTGGIYAQCECINGQDNTVHYNYGPPVNAPGTFVNRNSGNKSLGFESGKQYRVVMTRKAGSHYVCTNPAMSFENLSYNSNDYSVDFTYSGTNGWGFDFQYIVNNLPSGAWEEWEFEVSKKFAGIYYERHTYNYRVIIQCYDSRNNPYINAGYPQNVNYDHSAAKIETTSHITASQSYNNYYSDGGIYFDAGNYVDLQPGFTVTGSGYFEAFIDGCNGYRSESFSDEHGKEIVFADEDEKLSDPAVESNTTRNNSFNEFVYDVSFYPTPFNTGLQIKTNSSISKLEVYDQVGRLRKSFINLENSDKLEMSDLESGLYFFRSFVNETMVSNTKIVKN